MTEVIQQVADELFDVWKEAKGGEWDDIRWEGLSAKEKEQYHLTAKRIIALAREGYVKLAEDQALPHELRLHFTPEDLSIINAILKDFNFKKIEQE